MIYADTSAVIRAYMADEPGQPEMSRMLLQTDEPVLTSEITRIEFGGALVRAERAGRIRAATEVLGLFDRDSRSGAAIALVPLRREPTMELARDLAVRHGLGALDSIHLAVALAGADGLVPGVAHHELVFVTRDRNQAAAARAEGLSVA